MLKRGMVLVCGEEWKTMGLGGKRIYRWREWERMCTGELPGIIAGFHLHN